MSRLAEEREMVTQFFDAVEPMYVGLGLGIAVLTLLLLYGIWWFFRSKPPGKEFASLLSSIEDATVLMHTNPDPDAMASALAVAYLGELVGTEVEIMYPGQIRHQENRAFRTVLDLELTPISSADELPGDSVILVDHNRTRDFTGSESVSPVAIVDHHPNGSASGDFIDIRPEYGATASIIAEYCEEIGLETAPEELRENNGDDTGLPPFIATGLMYGILSDTDRFTRGCSPGEFNACSYLYPAIDQDILTRIANPEIDAEILDVRATAITNRKVRGPFAISDVGSISNVDAIPQAADELLQLEGITAVVVLGDKNDTLYLSGRSRDDRVHIGNVLHKSIEDIPMSSAGGHARMGGGQVSIVHLEGLRPESGMTRDEFISQLFTGLTEY